jgi:hypothetical protein
VGFVGGRDDTPEPVAVAAQSLGRYRSDDFVNFTGEPGLLLTVDASAGDADLRHWDALPYGVRDVVLFFDDLDGTGLNQVRVAHTSASWDAAAAATVGDKVCAL